MTENEFNTGSVFLRATDWVQTIANDTQTYPSGISLDAKCTATDDHSLTLSSGEPITQIPIELNLTRGPLTLGDGRSLDQGIGIFNYLRSQGIRPPSVIGCWIGVAPSHYDEVWAQVRSGAFTDCIVSLDLAPLPGPGQRLWQLQDNRGRLFVTEFTIRFKYSTPQIAGRSA